MSSASSSMSSTSSSSSSTPSSYLLPSEKPKFVKIAIEYDDYKLTETALELYFSSDAGKLMSSIWLGELKEAIYSVSQFKQKDSTTTVDRHVMLLKLQFDILVPDELSVSSGDFTLLLGYLQIAKKCDEIASIMFSPQEEKKAKKEADRIENEYVIEMERSKELIQEAPEHSIRMAQVKS